MAAFTPAQIDSLWQGVAERDAAAQAMREALP
jgi:hypothetical protein